MPYLIIDIRGNIIMCTDKKKGQKNIAVSYKTGACSNYAYYTNYWGEAPLRQESRKCNYLLIG